MRRRPDSLLEGLERNFKLNRVNLRHPLMYCLPYCLAKTNASEGRTARWGFGA